jgi:hypothetical protein
MTTTRIAAVAVAAALGVGGVGVPSAGASMSHWSKTQCKTYVKSFKKKHPKATKSQKSAANKTLKGHGCSQKV